MKFGRFEPTVDKTIAVGDIKLEHYLFTFPNGFGASVIRNPYSLGGVSDLFELAVLKKSGGYWRLNYKTPITSDVLGNLEVDDVVKALEDISNLADDYELLHQSFVDHDGNVVFVD